MAVITIRGQLGSGAPEIGKLVAEKLHFDYVDREIIEQVAKRIHSTERGIETKEMPPSRLIDKIEEALMYSSANSGPLGNQIGILDSDIPLDDDQYLAGLDSVIKELAKGNSIVIRGRGSQFILNNYPGSFHLFTVAPLEIRIKRVMEATNQGEDSARKEIERFDYSRRKFIKRYFKADLENPVHYDLVINTEYLSYENAASIVLYALSHKELVVSVPGILKISK
jgi:cytidylate kinase